MRPTVNPSRPRRDRLPDRRLRALPLPRVSPGRPLGRVAQARVEGAVSLAYQIAWWYARRRAPDVPGDELIAEALYGLTYAAGLFDEARRVPFGAYAALVIQHR